MHLSDLLQALGQSLKVDGLELNDRGVCRLLLDGKLELNIEHAPVEDAVHLYSTLGKAPDVERESFFASLLEAQHFAREIGEGCAFGLDASTGDVLLHRKLSVGDLNEETFYQALNEFANWGDHWRAKLSGEHSDEVDSAGSSETFSSAVVIRG